MAMRNLMAAAAFSVAFASPALAAQDGPLPYEKWDNSIRSMFFNTDMTLRPQADIVTTWKTLPAERQAAIRLDCDTAFPEPGSSDLTEVPNKATGNPVPGVKDQAKACEIIGTM